MQKLLFLILSLMYTADMISMQTKKSKQVTFEAFSPRYTKPAISIFQLAKKLQERDNLYNERTKKEKINRQARLQELADEQGITYQQACEQERNKKEIQKYNNLATRITANQEIIMIENQKKLMQQSLLEHQLHATKPLHDQLIIRYTIQDNFNFCKKIGQYLTATSLITSVATFAYKLNNPDL